MEKKQEIREQEIKNIPEELKKIVQVALPDLLPALKKLIVLSERNFIREPKDQPDSFLWEHTLQAAAVARQISLAENKDPLAPVLAALFHDAGKFASAGYHRDDIPEEIKAADLAEDLLKKSGIKESLLREVIKGLKALYNDTAARSKTADIVHDADFLVKSGCLGVASFFTKETLRGNSMVHALSQSLSKELTYAVALVENMRTRSGKAIAKLKKEKSLSFYTDLIRELKDHGIARFEIRQLKFPCPWNPEKFLNIHLALHETCPECGGNWTIDLDQSRGVKCEKLTALVQCQNCRWTEKIAFCLPEIGR
jgi:HD superfamily phosphodiesterase/predicted RNA-binding Zn-ribbon protein involved in translation (DUF1610 family)